jgi:lysozyme
MALADAVNIVIPFTEGWEKFAPSPYLDGTSYAIGYGNHYYEDGTQVSADDDAIDQPRAEQLMTFFLNQSGEEVLNQVKVPLTDNQLAALTDFAYNVGSITPTLLALINSGADPATVGTQIEKSAITAGGVPNAGLVNRRAAEAGLYQSTGTGFSGSLILMLAAGLLLLFGITRKYR